MRMRNDPRPRRTGLPPPSVLFSATMAPEVGSGVHGARNADTHAHELGPAGGETELAPPERRPGADVAPGHLRSLVHGAGALPRRRVDRVEKHGAGSVPDVDHFDASGQDLPRSGMEYEVAMRAGHSLGVEAERGTGGAGARDGRAEPQRQREAAQHEGRAA